MSSNNLARFRSIFICTRSSRRSPPRPAAPGPNRAADASPNTEPSLIAFRPRDSTEPTSTNLCLGSRSSLHHLGLAIAELTLVGRDDKEESSSVGGSLFLARRRLAPISARISCCARPPYMQGKGKGPVTSNTWENRGQNDSHSQGQEKFGRGNKQYTFF